MQVCSPFCVPLTEVECFLTARAVAIGWLLPPGNMLQAQHAIGAWSSLRVHGGTRSSGLTLLKWQIDFIAFIYYIDPCPLLPCIHTITTTMTSAEDVQKFHSKIRWNKVSWPAASSFSVHTPLTRVIS